MKNAACPPIGRGPWLDATAARDQTAIVAWPQTSGIPSILVGSANYEDTSATGASVLRYDPGTSKVEEAIPGVPESIGPLALGTAYPELTKRALVCVTETTTRAEIERFAGALKRALERPI